MGAIVIKSNQLIIDRIEVSGIKAAINWVKAQKEDSSKTYEYSTINSNTRIENTTILKR
jgi:tRNA U38,U39,U40 pseudouridine synthase TruA